MKDLFASVARLEGGPESDDDVEDDAEDADSQDVLFLSSDRVIRGLSLTLLLGLALLAIVARFARLPWSSGASGIVISSVSPGTASSSLSPVAPSSMSDVTNSSLLILTLLACLVDFFFAMMGLAYIVGKCNFKIRLGLV